MQRLDSWGGRARRRLIVIESFVVFLSLKLEVLLALVLDQGLLQIALGGSIEDRLGMSAVNVVDDYSCVFRFSTVFKVASLRNGEPLVLAVVAEAYCFAPLHPIKLIVIQDRRAVVRAFAFVSQTIVLLALGSAVARLMLL